MLSKFNKLFSTCEKFANKNPFENAEQDIEDALDHASDYIVADELYSKIPVEWFDIEKIEKFPINELNQFDSFDWLETEQNEYLKLSRYELERELVNLRGRHAKDWVKNGIPAIVIVDTPVWSGIGDGRGRCNFAVGMGYKTVPAIFLKLKEEYFDRVSST